MALAKISPLSRRLVERARPESDRRTVRVMLTTRRKRALETYTADKVHARRPGQRVHIKIDALNGDEFEGKVDSLSGGTGASFSLLPPDNASGNFVKVVQRIPVRISWNGPASDRIPAGSSAEVTVYTK